MEARTRVVDVSMPRLEGAGGLAEQAEMCPAPAERSPLRCPVCGREDALVPVGEALFCAACGYASDGAAGCT